MIYEHCRETAEAKRIICRAHILYMEDDLGLSALLKKRLERMAYLVDLARDGIEGLAMLENTVYDVIIADYHMPLLNGLEVLKKFNKSIPVIILTGQGDESIAVEAMKLGAADYVIKDVHGEYLEILPSVIDRVLERRQLILDRRQALAELTASEARYRAIVEDQTELICRLKPGGNLSFANAAFCRFFAIMPADIAFHSLATLMPRPIYQQMKGLLETLSPQNPTAMNIHDIKLPDGKIRWLQWTYRALFLDGKLTEYQLVGRDITELKAIEEALRISEEKNGALLNAIPDPILRLDRHGACVDLRVKEGHLLQLPANFVGKNIADFFPSDVAALLLEHIHKVFLEGASQVCQFILHHAHGENHQEARLVFAGNNEVLVILRDVTDRYKLEQNLQYLCIHDSLTGLYNRAYFEEELLRLENSGQPAGIIICDIDGLKMVNDTLGHAMGDELIQTASRIIRQAFRDNDAVARIGGDEFAVLLPNATQEVVSEACSRIKTAIAQYNQSHPKLFLSISVGAAVSSAENQGLGEVFRRADANMYTDKTYNRETLQQTIQNTLREIPGKRS